VHPRRLWLVTTVVALIALRAAPVAAQATGVEPLSPTPPRTVHRVQRGLLIAGIVTFQASWGLAVLTGVTAFAGCIDSDPGCTRGPDRFMIPIAGPFIVASGHYQGVPTSWAPALVAWGVVEAAGAAMLVAGLVGHDVPVPASAPPTPRISLAPMLSPEVRGLALGAAW